MPWIDDSGPKPQRSERELLDVVQRRAGAIRRRRRAAMSAAVACLASVLLAAAVLAGTGDDRSTELHVVGDGSTTTSLVPPTTVVVTSTVPPAPTTIPPTTRTTVKPTTTTKATTTTVRPTTTTSSTLPPPLRQCAPGDVVVTATPERTTYPAGTSAKVLVAGQNRSLQACDPIDPAIELRNGAGAVQFTLGVADAFTFGTEGSPPPSWDAGETHSITFDVPTFCQDGKPCPLGPYTVTAIFGPFRSAPASFTLV